MNIQPVSFLNMSPSFARKKVVYATQGPDYRYPIEVEVKDQPKRTRRPKAEEPTQERVIKDRSHQKKVHFSYDGEGHIYPCGYEE